MHCHHFAAGRCRSCTHLPTPYADQLAWKQQHARELLAAWPDAKWLSPVSSRERGFRNKAKMVVSGSWEAPVLGTLGMAGRGEDLRDCPLYPEALACAFEPLIRFIRLARIAPYELASRSGELKYLLLTLSVQSGELMIRFVLRSQEAVGRMRKHLATLQDELPQLRVLSVNLQPEHKAVLEGEREILLSGSRTLQMRLNGLPLHLRPQSFYQTNDEVAAALYAQARDWCDELQPGAIWDLFCGVGGFALHCAAPGRRVTGIEISTEAIQSACQSRDELALADVEFRALDAADFAAGQTEVPPLVILNPPRRGIGPGLCAFLEASAARWLIYSSCNAPSLARDLERMPSFRPLQVRLLDMFPHSHHYELITLLERDG
ncbi:23S rRNA (uracil(747)-C(5))-methyltransferase RlmC [Marinobacterium aestuariivivens]|uniref:23S rRNA (uracil(747)-C(5))-methyltransferase RlmC n=2 Tax=Marinobacterium aestuariivivens TaxID=1698799 RepID=A0ABW2A225_9GAMM